MMLFMVDIRHNLGILQYKLISYARFKRLNNLRENWCMKRVHKLMGFAIGAKYVESAFDPQAKIDMKEMILNLKMAFSSLVEESDWMDEETKINALEKAAAMKEYIGYPDWITNKSTLELAYHGV
jgi:membrane metallo-endopeptidase-like protein 1